MFLMNRHSIRYTLVEILVAVAVLVIMMGFLFQFTISAQRIWASTTARMTVADQAQAVFNIFDKDLTQMVVETEKGLEIGWYCSPAPDNDSPSGNENITLCFYTHDTEEIRSCIDHEKVVTYTRVKYCFINDGRNGKLYRFANSDPEWDKIGRDAKEPTSINLISDIPKIIEDSDSDPVKKEKEEFNGEHLVAENIVKFTIQADTNPNKTNSAKGGLQRPQWIKLVITLHIPEDLRNGATNDENATDRTFTKLFVFSRE